MFTIRTSTLPFAIALALFVLGCDPATFTVKADATDTGSVDTQVTDVPTDQDTGSDTAVDTEADEGSDDDAEADVVQCGTVDQDCCESDVCDSGLVCSSGTCLACGGEGEACCAGDTCDTLMYCNQGTCELDLRVPDPGPCTCPAGGQCFSEYNLGDGWVFEPTTEVPTTQLTFIPGSGNYKNIKIYLDVFNGGWDPDAARIAHNLFTALRSKSYNNLFGEVDFRNGAGSDQVEVLHNLQTTAKERVTKDAQLPEYNWYGIDYEYNTGTRTLNLRLTNKTMGSDVVTFTGFTNVGSISIGTNETVDVSFGHDGTDPTDAVSRGWKYANLCVILVP